MAQAGFGRRTVAIDDELARRRAAFVAAERARAAEQAERRVVDPFEGAARPRTVYIKEKSLGTAYALWLCMATSGAHRFYLGYPVSASILAVMWFGSLWSLFAVSSNAVYTLGAAGLWILADAAMIPGLHKSANMKLRRAPTEVFA